MAASADAFSFFNRFIEDDQLVEMTFTQTHYDEDGRALEKNAGVLQYQRPNLFRLNYESPRQPLLVSDGEQLWYYEVDLHQVVVSPLATAKKNGLLAMLASGDLRSFRRHYLLTAAVGDGNNLTWLNAVPLDKEDSVRRIRLGFAGDSGDLRQIRVTDAFGGAIRMDITLINRHNADAGFFSFTPPDGVEIVHLSE